MAVILLLIPIVPSISTAGTVDSLKITFGRNEGRLAFSRIIREYGPDIAALVNRHNADSNSQITIISNSDGVRYAQDHLKRNILMTEERTVTGTTLLDYYQADLNRVVIVPLNNDADTGSANRYLIFRRTSTSPLSKSPVGLIALNGANEGKWKRQPLRPPAPIAPAGSCDSGSRLWLGIGASYAPHERFVPHVQAQWGTERIRIIAEASYSCYSQDRTFAGEELQVTYRYVIGGFAWRVIRYSQFDLIAAWQRSEVYSTQYGRYARKLEGPALGVRLLLNKHVSLTGLWTPSEEQLRGRAKTVWDDNRFYIGLTFFTSVSGGK